MGGFAMAFAGALKGLGSGMATKGQADLELRYREALENLKAQNKLANNQSVADLNDRNSARDDERDLNNKLTLQRDTQAYNTRMAQAGAKAQAAEKAADRAHEVRITELRAKLDKENSEASVRLKGDIDGGKVQDVRSDSETGKTWIFYNNGTVKEAEGVTLKPKPAAKSDGTGYLLNYGTKNSVADYTWDSKTGKLISNKED